MSNTAKNKILKKIRMALAQPTPLPFPESERNESVFQPQQQDPLVEFAEQFTQLQGKFSYSLHAEELKANLLTLLQQNGWTKVYVAEASLKNLVPDTWLYTDIAACHVAITSCEVLVARTGSILLSSAQQGRVPSVYAPVHICIAGASQLVYDIGDALAFVKNKYGDSLPSLITLATGPSRTADIEKTLVVGVHGPGEVYCLVVEDEQQASH
ncbi:MAG: LutC/YkgG family protein [Flavisolibacter sp.]